MPAPLSHDTVTEAGVRLVAAHGWEALSLRAVASELGVTPMALYRHVADSDALASAVLEGVLAHTADVRATGDLVLDLATWARRFHADLLRFPGVAGRLLTNWFESPGMLERTDALLELVSAHGIDGFEAVATTNAVLTYVLMRCEAERQVRTAGAVKRELATARSSQPLTKLRSLTRHYTTARFAAHFDYGLDALLRGMELVRSGKEPTR